MAEQLFSAGVTTLEMERLSFIDAGDHAIEVGNYCARDAAGEVVESGK